MFVSGLLQSSVGQIVAPTEEEHKQDGEDTTHSQNLDLGWSGFLSTLSAAITSSDSIDRVSDPKNAGLRQRSSLSKMFTNLAEMLAPLPPELQKRRDLYTRAVTYPYFRPARSFLFVDGEAYPLVSLGDSLMSSSVVHEGQTYPIKDFLSQVCGIDPLQIPDFEKRAPVLAYGSNAAPEQLTRKFCLSAEAGSPRGVSVIPTIKARLEDFDSVYAASITGYGAVPATLAYSAGTAVEVFITYLDRHQLEIMHSTEGSYDFIKLKDVRLSLASPENKLPCLLPERTEGTDSDVSERGDDERLLLGPGEVYSYISRNGALVDPDCSPTEEPQRLLSLAGCEASDRCSRALTQEEMLLLVAHLSGEGGKTMDLEEFVVQHLESKDLRRRRAARLQNRDDSGVWRTMPFRYPGMQVLQAATNQDEAAPESAAAVNTASNAIQPAGAILVSKEDKSQAGPPHIADSGTSTQDCCFSEPMEAPTYVAEGSNAPAHSLPPAPGPSEPAP